MKGLIILLLFASVVALMFFSFSKIERTSLFPGFTLAHRGRRGDDLAAIKNTRKLKEMSHPSIIIKRSGRNVKLDDYLPIDPPPNLKASIWPGPIEHDTPLMPFIPKSPPPIPGPHKNGP